MHSITNRLLDHEHSATSNTTFHTYTAYQAFEEDYKSIQRELIAYQIHFIPPDDTDSDNSCTLASSPTQQPTSDLTSLLQVQPRDHYSTPDNTLHKTNTIWSHPHPR
mmetsp:Transcript_27047/g.38333  ORF Transcript_27047/g.38333 Transcript_27047/m.38333 type:complete len:107 (-) Transcript_27047:21-341(-)